MMMEVMNFCGNESISLRKFSLTLYLISTYVVFGGRYEIQLMCGRGWLSPNGVIMVLSKHHSCVVDEPNL